MKMDDYPNPDEEYELLHQEEMEVMREMQVMREMEQAMVVEYYDPKPKKSRSSLNFDSVPKDQVNERTQEWLGNSKTNETLSEDNNTRELSSSSVSKKRGLSSESLIDISADLEVIERPSKKLKKNVSSNFKIDPSHEFGTTSIRVPKWPFMPISTEYGERLYVKVNDGIVNEDVTKYFTNNNDSLGLLSSSYTNIKSQAEETVKICKSIRETKHVIDIDIESQEGSDLWVEKYKPRTYFDLLSDESVNRTLLSWLKMWDKIVFNKEPKVKLEAEIKKDEKPFNKFINRNEVNKELDSDGRPHYKIALLCGPPGLGKTTLAHVAADLAGYNVVEVNASDDRTVEAFNTKLDAATQMQSVMGANKPNCLVLDEIDGAPASTIEFLLKYLNGKVNEKVKKGKKEKPIGVVKRPVICICNELYTPSLRHLRQQSFIVHFPNTSSTKLALRLLEICRKQDIKTDLSTLTLLSDKAQNDIRSCISTLHFFKSKHGQRFKSADVLKSNVGQKDIQKGMFNIWKEIFQIPINKKNLFSSTFNKGIEEEVSSYINYSKKGMDKLQSIVQMLISSTDYERLLQGVYENFLRAKFMRSTESVKIGLEWFSWFDLLDTNIKKAQNFMLMPYLPYSFAAWHILFSSNTFWKINYPNLGYENHMKEVRSKQILNDLLQGLNATVRSSNQRHNILLDVLPILSVILVPPLRPVNPTLFNDKEKLDFKKLIDIMIDYNLNYIQQRADDGTYFYEFDPNIEKLTKFNLETRNDRKTFSYSTKQLISHEVELERLRRAEGAEKIETKEIGEASKSKGSATAGKTKPVMVTKLKPKEIDIKRNEAQYKDFFGRIVKVKDALSASKGKEDDYSVKSPIWFSYKEGYNNAVKKDITMADLL